MGVSDLKKRVGADVFVGVKGVPGVVIRASLVSIKALLVGEFTGVVQSAVSRDTVGTITCPCALSINMEPNIKAANNNPPINKNTSKILVSPDISGGVGES